MPHQESESAEKPCLLVFGAGGHGRVVADAALASGQWDSVWGADRSPSRCTGQLLNGVELLAPEVALGFTQAGIHVAIGDNSARFREATTWGLARLVTVKHPQVAQSDFSRVAAGCFLAAGAVVAPNADLAMCVIVNHHAVVDHDAVIGSFTHIAPGAVIGGDVRIGAHVLVGSGAVVMPGLSICERAIIGAGAVVCSDITQPGTYVGVPARRVA